MKRFIILLAISVLSLSVLSAQDIKAVFTNLPEEIIFGLTAEQKNKLASNPQDSVVIVDDSSIYEEIMRTSISDDYIAIKTSDVGSVQIKLLPLVNDSKVICVVRTACKDICDSQVNFYTTNWDPIEKTSLLPSLPVDWFIKPGTDKNSEQYKDAVSVLDIDPVKMTLSPDNYTLKAELDVENYLNKESYDTLKPYLVDSKVFIWDKVSFK